MLLTKNIYLLHLYKLIIWILTEVQVLVDIIIEQILFIQNALFVEVLTILQKNVLKG